ncbi:MAG: hypothetical protein ACRDDH_07890 [Cetobacterium sp.]|uniref:hypothetical protein n=1 Tax=Cetobacterium sp. TaxID=2071632 RepID=UPI003EE47FD0
MIITIIILIGIYLILKSIGTDICNLITSFSRFVVRFIGMSEEEKKSWYFAWFVAFIMLGVISWNI